MPGVELNLGAIGKGYALDRASVGLRRAAVEHALLSAGRSSLLAMGGRGDGWRIDLVSPLVAGHAIAGLWLRNAALGTSGAGEQFVIADGRRYGHVIDPRTGWPANGVVTRQRRGLGCGTRGCAFDRVPRWRHRTGGPVLC